MSNPRLKAAVLIAASACALTAACTCDPVPPPGIQASALHELLLSPDKASEIVGTTLIEIKTGDDMGDEAAFSAMSDKQCLGVTEEGGKTEYANSGWTAVRKQLLANLPGELAQQQSPVEFTQAVVLFPSAQQAAAFYTSASKTWSACANKKVGVTAPKMKAFGLPTQIDMSVGRVSDADDTLTAEITSSEVVKGINMTVNCQHALTVANNVVIDVSACGAKLPDHPSPRATDDAAVSGADEIAVNVDDHDES